jgi:hypothetical protein
VTVNDDFFELVGEDLSGVVFVRDYVQLQFDPPPSLNAGTPVTVHSRGGRATLGEEAFANLIIGQIGKVVRSASIQPDVALVIEFDDGSTISVSLIPSDYYGPEAVNLFRKDGSVVVI